LLIDIPLRIMPNIDSASFAVGIIIRITSFCVQNTIQHF
jgi:hypothetical protein